MVFNENGIFATPFRACLVSSCLADSEAVSRRPANFQEGQPGVQDGLCQFHSSLLGLERMDSSTTVLENLADFQECFCAHIKLTSACFRTGYRKCPKYSDNPKILL